MDYGLLAGVLAGVSVLAAVIGIKKNKESSHWLAVRNRVNLEAKPKDPLERWTREATAAGIEVPKTQLAAAALAGAVVGAGAVLGVTGKIAFAPAGLIFGLIAPGVWLKRKVQGRAETFEEQFEMSLTTMGSSLRAGQNVQQAFEQAALSAEPPASEVLGRVVHMMRTGYTLPSALEETGKMVKSRDMDMVSTATALHAQTGGDLALIYDQVADAIRDRRAFKAQVGAATSEGRLTANVLVLLPFLGVGMMRYLSPEYMAPLFSTQGGLMILGVCSLVIIFGWLVIKRLAVVEY